MKKYAEIIDEKTKVCKVGLGDNNLFYKSIGMTEMDVEQAYNGSWYLSGYAPEKPQKLNNQERINELLKYLNNTDWYVARYSETGVKIPEEIKIKRQKARDEISELRGDTNNATNLKETSINAQTTTTNSVV